MYRASDKQLADLKGISMERIALLFVSLSRWANRSTSQCWSNHHHLCPIIMVWLYLHFYSSFRITAHSLSSYPVQSFDQTSREAQPHESSSSQWNDHSSKTSQHKCHYTCLDTSDAPSHQRARKYVREEIALRTAATVASGPEHRLLWIQSIN